MLIFVIIQIPFLLLRIQDTIVLDSVIATKFPFKNCLRNLKLFLKRITIVFLHYIRGNDFYKGYSYTEPIALLFSEGLEHQI